MKIEEQVLSREQMKHLQELGVDTSDASMYWVRAKRMTGGRKNDCIGNDEAKWRLSLSKDIILPAAWTRESVPTYTIGDLIEKLPKSINIGYRWSDLKILIEGEYAEVRYMDNRYYCPPFYSRSLFIELLYNLLCEVAENHKELLEVRND